MWSTEPFHVLVLAISIMIAECKPPLTNKMYNIKKFLGTSSPIWTFATTAGSHCLCQADLTQYIDEMKIFYIHYFLSQGHTKKHLRMDGVFRKKNVVYVHPHGSANEVKHKILYFNKQVKCAVIKVSWMISPGGQIEKMDLRVWNTSNVASSAQPCLPVFQSLSSKPGHIVYKSMCQKELGKGQSSQDQDVEGRMNPRDFVCRNYG
uniref:Putative group i salivary lipocalin n=1 Tax=Rhipicephalus pulchellus TaxID=72859 RepID=L7LRB2_RHIPC